LFWGKLFRFLGKALKWIAIAALVATAVITTIGLIAGPAALHTFLTTTLGKILSFVAGIPNRIGHFILGLPKTIAGIFSFAGEVSDRVAAMTGYGVLLGGGTTIGAIEKHQRKRRAERQRRRRSKEIEHRPDVNPGEIVGEVVGRAIAAIMARPIPQPPPTPTPEPPCPDYNPYPNYSGPYRGQYPAGYMPWKVPYGPDVERAYGDARGGPFNSRLSDASRAFGNSPWANCVRGCLLSAWNPCQQRYKPDFTTTHTICYGICTGSAILGEK
jgi:hypothetical protein